jgi:hypothetical protein
MGDAPLHLSTLIMVLTREHHISNNRRARGDAMAGGRAHK